VLSVTRIVIVDPQPASRAGLAMLLRSEPGLIPVGTAIGAHDGADLVARQRPDVVLVEHHLPDGDGPSLTRRLRALEGAPHVIVYTADPDPGLSLLARVAGAGGVVDKAAEPAELFEAIRVVARGGSALPPLDAVELDAAAHRVEPDDLALLAMLVDQTPPDDVADALRLDRRRLGRRTERLLGRLRARPEPTVAA
jgi:DNA-binding NarL/FixJ family response regulator